MASGSPKISQVVAALPPETQRRFYQAKALYRFLDNRRVSAEAILKQVIQLGLETLQGEELLVLVDISPIKKPYAEDFEGLSLVSSRKVPGYELLTCLGVDRVGHLGLGYARLLAYRERGLTTLPREISKALAEASQNLGAEGRKLIFVFDRGFDDRKVFLQIKDLNQAFIARVHHDRTLDDRRKLKAVAEGLGLPFRGKAWVKVQGKYMPVDIHFGFEPIKLLGQDFTLVVSRVPALGNRGNWWLLTNLELRTVEDAWGVVEAYRKRWQVEEFFRLLKAGLGVEKFQVSRLWAIRKLIAVLLGLALFLWEVKREESPFKDLLLWLGGKLGIPSERDGPYLLMRGFLRLLNYEVARELLEAAQPPT
jgi:hypothetical protein